MISPTSVEPPKFDYEPVSAFPLLWRWTQSTHDVLTPEELASIRPLRHESAQVASDYARVLRGFADRAPNHAFQFADGNEPDLSQWLTRLPVRLEHVVLSWSPTLAAETVWPLFLSRWSAFWYPSSDNLEVFPLSGSWLLQVSDFGRCTWTASPTRQPSGAQ
jgi:hypothetical protein